jgi:hypothetical protein
MLNHQGEKLDYPEETDGSRFAARVRKPINELTEFMRVVTVAAWRLPERRACPGKAIPH